jgi:hypothetical protein
MPCVRPGGAPCRCLPANPPHRRRWRWGSTTVARAAQEQGADRLNDVVWRRTPPVCLRGVVQRRAKVIVAHMHVGTMLLDQPISRKPLPRTCHL